MHVDLNQAAGQAPADAAYRAQVCIVGAGIAGLTLATRLAAAGLDVHLLEAGGLEQEASSQAFYATEQAGDTHRGVSDGRFRTFGGSSTQWGGQLLPFTPDILTPLPGMPSRAWPVAESELSPFYADIQAIFATDTLPFDASLLPALGHPAVDLSDDLTLRFSKWAPFKKRNLAQTLGPVALAHARITVFTHANAAAFDGVDGTITQVRAVDYAGRSFAFRAQHFVVAAGTVESSRLLLSSPAVPNAHDQLGRFFSDHLSFHAAELRSPASERLLTMLGPFFVDGTLHTCKLEASAAARARDGMLAAMAHVVVQEPADSGAAAIRNMLRSVQSGRLREALGENLPAMLRGSGDVARLLYAARFKRRRAVSSRARVMLNVDVEQAPDPANRIRLSANRDALGLPVAIVDWRIGRAEANDAVRFARRVREQLTQLGLTPFDWHASLEDGSAPPLLDTYHAMGGLCMSHDPRTGVVDAQLGVHGLGNLHVASCAVFPSGSSSNPTFTMMALTLRLADRLASMLG